MEEHTPGPKVILDTAGVPAAVQQFSIELGLDNFTIAQLGEEWRQLCNAWVAAEVALTHLGSSTIPWDFEPPQSLVDWSNSRSQADLTVVDFTEIGDQLRVWWNKCVTGITSADDAVGTSWCQCGIRGIMMLVVGLKEWGHQLKTRKDAQKWSKMVAVVMDVFDKLPYAEKL